jgi:hypothetical protein
MAQQAIGIRLCGLGWSATAASALAAMSVTL